MSEWQTYEQEYKDDKTLHCEKCGTDYREGDYPFCKGKPSGHGVMYGFDDAFEPYVDTQILNNKDPRCTSVNELGLRGVMINSRSERRELMREKGLQFGSQKFEERGKKLYFT
jgi:hypothetical protein